MKLAMEMDSKLGSIINVKLVKTTQQVKENMQKIELLRSSLMNDTGWRML